MNCNGQCHGCAFKLGAAANLEAGNKLRGIFAALGGIPFFCHDSLGWKPGQTGYPKGAEDSLTILSNRAKIIAAGADPAKLDAQTAEIRASLHICEGCVRRQLYSSPGSAQYRRTLSCLADNSTAPTRLPLAYCILTGRPAAMNCLCGFRRRSRSWR